MNNREIKFRAWEQHGAMNEEVFVDLFGVWSEPETGHNTPHREIEKLDGAIAMQDSGMTDIYSKSIYEGDFLECYKDGEKIGVVDEVIFTNGCFFLKRRNCSIHHFTNTKSAEEGCQFEVKVIGNIYQTKPGTKE